MLERPEIPLHTNDSERDIRDYVKKRKVSGGHPQRGRQAVSGHLHQLEENLPQARLLLLGLPQ